MTNTREDVVRELVRAAQAAMVPVAEATNATGSELISALFTALRQGIQSALIITDNPVGTRKALRESVYTLLADVADQQLN